MHDIALSNAACAMHTAGIRWDAKFNIVQLDCEVTSSCRNKKIASRLVVFF
jgi:hypothetical protein